VRNQRGIISKAFHAIKKKKERGPLWEFGIKRKEGESQDQRESKSSFTNPEVNRSSLEPQFHASERKGGGRRRVGTLTWEENRLYRGRFLRIKENRYQEKWGKKSHQKRGGKGSP